MNKKYRPVSSATTDEVPEFIVCDTILFGEDDEALEETLTQSVVDDVFFGV